MTARTRDFRSSGPFGRALLAEMTAQRVKVATLADTVGVTPDRVTQWRMGRGLPSMRSAARISEALLSPRLLLLVKQARSKSCLTCHKVFVADVRFQRYCSERCAQVVANRRRRGITGDERKRKLHLLAVYEEAVESLCREWCPIAGPQSWLGEGFCPDASCPPQHLGLSPLPLAAEEVA